MDAILFYGLCEALKGVQSKKRRFTASRLTLVFCRLKAAAEPSDFGYENPVKLTLCVKNVFRLRFRCKINSKSFFFIV